MKGTFQQLGNDNLVGNVQVCEAQKSRKCPLELLRNAGNHISNCMHVTSHEEVLKSNSKGME